MSKLLLSLFLAQLLSNVLGAVTQTKSTSTEGEINISNGGDSVTFTLVVKYLGWFGISLGQGMSNKDMFIVEVDSDGSVTVSDLWSTGTVMPKRDTQQDLVLISQSTSNASHMQVSFSRKLDTGDKTQDSILKVGSQYTWSYATSTDLELTRKHSSKGTYSVKFGIKSPEELEQERLQAETSITSISSESENQVIVVPAESSIETILSSESSDQFIDSPAESNNEATLSDTSISTGSEGPIQDVPAESSNETIVSSESRDQIIDISSESSNETALSDTIISTDSEGQIVDVSIESSKETIVSSDQIIDIPVDSSNEAAPSIKAEEDSASKSTVNSILTDSSSQLIDTDPTNSAIKSSETLVMMTFLQILINFFY